MPVHKFYTTHLFYFFSDSRDGLNKIDDQTNSSSSQSPTRTSFSKNILVPLHGSSDNKQSVNESTFEEPTLMRQDGTVAGDRDPEISHQTDSSKIQPLEASLPGLVSATASVKDMSKLELLRKNNPNAVVFAEFDPCKTKPILTPYKDFEQGFRDKKSLSVLRRSFSSPNENVSNIVSKFSDDGKKDTNVEEVDSLSPADQVNGSRYSCSGNEQKNTDVKEVCSKTDVKLVRKNSNDVKFARIKLKKLHSSGNLMELVALSSGTSSPDSCEESDEISRSKTDANSSTKSISASPSKSGLKGLSKPPEQLDDIPNCKTLPCQSTENSNNSCPSEIKIHDSFNSELAMKNEQMNLDSENILKGKVARMKDAFQKKVLQSQCLVSTEAENIVSSKKLLLKTEKLQTNNLKPEQHDTTVSIAKKNSHMEVTTDLQPSTNDFVADHSKMNTKNSVKDDIVEPQIFFSVYKSFSSTLLQNKYTEAKECPQERVIRSKIVHNLIIQKNSINSHKLKTSLSANDAENVDDNTKMDFTEYNFEPCSASKKTLEIGSVFNNDSTSPIDLKDNTPHNGGFDISSKIEGKEGYVKPPLPIKLRKTSAVEDGIHDSNLDSELPPPVPPKSRVQTQISFINSISGNETRSDELKNTNESNKEELQKSDYPITALENQESYFFRLGPENEDNPILDDIELQIDKIFDLSCSTVGDESATCPTMLFVDDFENHCSGDENLDENLASDGSSSTDVNLCGSDHTDSGVMVDSSDSCSGIESPSFFSDKSPILPSSKCLKGGRAGEANVSLDSSDAESDEKFLERKSVYLEEEEKSCRAEDATPNVKSCASIYISYHEDGSSTENGSDIKDSDFIDKTFDNLTKNNPDNIVMHAEEIPILPPKLKSSNASVTIKLNAESSLIDGDKPLIIVSHQISDGEFDLFLQERLINL